MSLDGFAQWDQFAAPPDTAYLQTAHKTHTKSTANYLVNHAIHRDGYHPAGILFLQIRTVLAAVVLSAVEMSTQLILWL